MKNIHKSLVNKYPKYQHWHERGYHEIVHWLTFLVVSVFISIIFLQAQAVNTPPSINLISPTDGSSVNSNNVQLSFTTSGNPTSCWYDMGGDDTYTLPNCQGTSIYLPNNDYVINLYASNQYGTDLVSSWFKTSASGDTEKPVVTAFNIPQSSSTNTISITTFTATDNVGVTGYKLTESSTTPSYNASGWKSNPQTSYTFNGTGLKTLYSWARDAAGNISLSSSKQINIGNTDIISPTITTFTTPTTTVSTTITGITFTATDNVGVTGYKITESNVAPTSGWSTTAPTSYTITSSNTGEKKLYAWTKDAAGNISQPKTSTTNYSYHFYYLSPSGLDTNACTYSSPCFTLNRAWQLVTAGDTVYLRGGVYSYTTEQILENKSGSDSNFIKIFAYPNESPKLVGNVPWSSRIKNAFIKMTGSYLYVKGLEISGYKQLNNYNYPSNTGVYPAWKSANVLVIGDPNIYNGGSSHCIFENLNIHHNGGGISLYGNNSTDNHFINIDVHHNSDPYTGQCTGVVDACSATSERYGNADGISIIGCRWDGSQWIGDSDIVNYITGSRVYRHSDDGIDAFWYRGILNIDNTWVFKNGYIPGYNEGDNDTDIKGGNGVGIKLGASPSQVSYQSGVKRYLNNIVTAYNGINGITNNTSTLQMIYRNCTSYRDDSFAWGYDTPIKLENPGSGSSEVSNCVVHSSKEPLGPFAANIGLLNVVNTSALLKTASGGGVLYKEDGSFNVTDNDFLSLDYTEMLWPRQQDGSLPNINFMHLAPGSDLINAGTNVGLPYNGNAPDLGAFETNY